MEKVLGMIGMAKRAGKITTGEFLCMEAIKKHFAKLVIIADDASDNSKKSITNSCDFYKVPYRIFSDKEQLGKYTGGGERIVVAVNDRNFAKTIISKMELAVEKG